MNKMLKEQILKLREEGYSYNKIAETLGCAKSTVSYHCSDKVKESTKRRKEKQKEENPAIFNFSKKVSAFKHREKGIGYPNMTTDWNKKFRTSVSYFRNGGVITMEDYTYKDAIEHIGGQKTKCYLTGNIIDIEKDDFSLDHIIPIDKGGSNSLENMGITIPVANRSKTNLTLEEYIGLCKTVLENFGYTITK